MGCGNIMMVVKPSGINSATLEWESDRHVQRMCGSTSYSGGTNLCGGCQKNDRPTYEYERDNPSYEEDY